MKKKRILSIILWISLSAIIIIGGITMYAILKIFVFDMCENVSLVESFEIDKNNKVEFYYLAPTSLSRGCLKLIFINEDEWFFHKSKLYDSYNYVEKVSLTSKGSLSFIAKVKRDSIVYRTDTIYVDLSKNR